jgi:hypothetical protein
MTMCRSTRRSLWTLGLVLLLGCASSPPVAAPAAEAAAPGLGALVLAALDGEALFTVAGGIKPVSSGFWKTSIVTAEDVSTEVSGPVAGPRSPPDLSAVDLVRRHLATLCDDALWWGVLPFAEVHEGRRHLHAYVVDRAAMAATLTRRADFFAPLGLGAASEPAEVLAIVERLPRAARFRGYGLLFGYPDQAVEFFVAADTVGEQQPSGVAPRTFRSIPTFASATGRFVYAVPPDHQPGPDERELAARCEEVLAGYRDDRPRWAGAPRALLRATRARGGRRRLSDRGRRAAA